MSDYPHVEKAIDYAEKVVAKKIPASELTILACKRQLKDLNRKFHKTDWPYRFDLVKASRVCRFIELLPHIKGEWAGKKISLEPWQCFYLTTLFGWVYASTGYRRFRTSYLEVPRKNAKSTISSGVMLYMATADGEAGAECYSAATSKKQARIVFDVTCKMAKKARGLASKYGVLVRAHDIIIDKTDSVCEPVSAEANNLDGLNVHFGSVDELHAHKTREVYDVIETGAGARAQSLLSVITTSGSDRNGICYEIRDYVVKVLKGVFKDESFFGIIYTIDKKDDWTTELSFMKANPNYGISVKKEYLRNLCNKARRSAASQANFKTKHLDIWSQSDTAWMNMVAWDKCDAIATKLDDFRGRECWIGLDLASKVDIAALVMVFPYEGEWFIFCKFYLPQDAIEDSQDDNATSKATLHHYETWSQQGFITLTPGSVIDFDMIEDDLRECCQLYDVKSIGFDPWQATQMANNLLKEKLPMVEVRQTTENLSAPMKELEALVRSNKLRPGGNPVLTWMASNVVAHLDKKDNIFPNKERKDNKIDGIIALIIAIARAIFHEDGFESVYDKRDGVVL